MTEVLENGYFVLLKISQGTVEPDDLGDWILESDQLESLACRRNYTYRSQIDDPGKEKVDSVVHPYYPRAIQLAIINRVTRTDVDHLPGRRQRSTRTVAETRLKARHYSSNGRTTTEMEYPSVTVHPENIELKLYEA